MKFMRHLVRDVANETGLPYATCLQVVRGELHIVPRSPDCSVLAALRKHFDRRVIPPAEKGAPERACGCEKCAGAEEK